ncbi:aspartate racemase [Erythrobacter sp. Dej080120_24]|uniref:aspartate/glutamate racemase family protein n=1 Tax=unclassified Erythrobacter TaxID=2633097 RepID=UPI002926CDF7|nr:aspartate racemase [Erythrobacter sp. Dej080120_24]
MKTIGIIGGMSWESSAQYYAIINRAVRDRLGPSHSAKILLHSLDFGPIAALQAAGEWDRLGEIMADSASALEAGGADCIVIATNTMHKMADRVEAATALPLLHIADATGEAIRAEGHARVALLGTGFTMEQDFLKARLAERHGLEIIIPDAEDRGEVHRVIYEELIAGKILKSSRDAYCGIITRLSARGAQAVIFGCTEIGLLLSSDDSLLPVFDTTWLHARAAAEFALKP